MYNLPAEMSGRLVAAIVHSSASFRWEKTFLGDVTFSGGHFGEEWMFLRQYIGKNLGKCPYFGIFTS
jgi:hypothetical protein